MTATILTAIITAASGAITGAAIAWIIAQKNKLKQKAVEKAEQSQALKDGVCALLRAEIIRQHEKHFEKGYCPIYAKEALKKAYEAYHNLGGNDVATKLFEEVMALPEKPKTDK